MAFSAIFGLHLQQGRAILQWVLVVVPMAAVVGSLVALFLVSLDQATALRFDYPWLISLMPVAGFAMVWAYGRFGGKADGGNNLLIDQIHEPGGGIPLRMTPFVLISTVLTHFVGGSAGREGTAVQMGGSVASAFGRVFHLKPAEVRILLMAGIAAGFGAVFGTPIAGAVFALEVLTIGRIQYEALLPALMAAITADWTCHAWGVEHTQYSIAYLGEAASHLDPLLLAKVTIAGVVFGVMAHVFADASHRLSALWKSFIPYAPLRPVAASVVLLGLVYLLGTRQYLGLGAWSPNSDDATIIGFFRPDHVDYVSWFWKATFTIITLSAGFKGGEVTPLFFIGAALGNAIGAVLGAPVDLFAGLGFVAVFAGATNTPLACMIMGIELFGATHTVYIAIACFLAYLCSGHSSIYTAQRVGVPKSAAHTIPAGTAVRHLRDLHVRASGEHLGIVPTAPPARLQVTESLDMPHHIALTEIGMVRIYLRPREKAPTSKWYSTKPLYRDLVVQAKAAGIMNAVAHTTNVGYSNHGKLHDDGVEIPNPDLTMCVELIAPRDRLEAFCRTHGSMLKGKVIVYKHLERWDVVGVDLTTDDAFKLPGTGSYRP